MTLQEQAWASVSPATVLQELQQKHSLKVEGDKLIVSPPPSPRLTFQIRRYKAKLLELMGAGKTVQERIAEAQAALGWKVKPNYEDEERKTIQGEPEQSVGIAMDFDPADTLEPEAQAPWPAPVVDRQVLEHYCQHEQAQHYRRKVNGEVVVQRLCPDCGRNMQGPRRFTKPSKRSAVPWWPEDTPVQPDPDAETDALVEWWAGIEGTLTDGCLWSLGVTVDHAATFRRSINELIGLWKLGDTDLGLKAQLTAHQRYREGSKDALLQRV
jgi:hypothetical protein